jgi:hypothetical protein
VPVSNAVALSCLTSPPSTASYLLSIGNPATLAVALLPYLEARAQAPAGGP